MKNSHWYSRLFSEKKTQNGDELERLTKENNLLKEENRRIKEENIEKEKYITRLIDKLYVEK